MTLYGLILLFSLAVPFIAGFHPRLQFYKKWPVLMQSVILSMIPFILWDVAFTEMGIWGFNEQYVSGVSWIGLPVEEWLFFFCIPYACVFMHYSILELRPEWQLSNRSVRNISYTLVACFLIVMVANWQLAYTVVDMLFAIIILWTVYKFDAELLRTFYLTFLFMLIPFFLVNGILTGSTIDGQIVWYNDHENMGIRLLTIPVEDLVYAFSLIMLNLVFFRRLDRVAVQSGVSM